MKVVFYLDNDKHTGVDYTNPEGGNPGIGGTHYMIWTISYYLSKKFEFDEFIVLAPIIDKLPEEIEKIKCIDLVDGIKKASEINADIFVFRGPQEDSKIYKLIDEVKLPSIMWSHNFEDHKSYNPLKYGVNCKYLKRNICVGKEQYDRLRDDDLYFKSTYIFNALDFKLYDGYHKSINEKENIVCFMGALEPIKGFHRIAKVWNRVLEQVPDAKLNVIGSGKLYNKDAKLGPYQLTGSKYEKKFIKYILDEKGEILPSISFLGVLGGSEKFEEMSKCKVGIANPIGKGETFCIVATEFQAIGVPVVSRKQYGLLDTIDNNNSGILINNDKELVDAIVKLLKDNRLNEELGNNGMKFVRDKFDINQICEEWMNLFNDIVNEKSVEIKYNKDNYLNDYKWLREINRILKYKLKFKILPSVMWYKSTLRKVKKKIFK